MESKRRASDYLKYWRVVRRYVQYRYGLTTAELELLLYLYSEDQFSTEKFADFEKVMVWEKNRIANLCEKGWIAVFRKAKRGRGNTGRTLYVTTTKTKTMIRGLYRMLDQEDLEPASRWRTKMYKKDWLVVDERYKEFMGKITRETKQLRRRALE